jgi:hypothetical protein
MRSMVEGAGLRGTSRHLPLPLPARDGAGLPRERGRKEDIQRFNW